MNTEYYVAKASLVRHLMKGPYVPGDNTVPDSNEGCPHQPEKIIIELHEPACAAHAAWMHTGTFNNTDYPTILVKLDLADLIEFLDGHNYQIVQHPEETEES